MEETLKILSQTELFAGIPEEQIADMLTLFAARECLFCKEEVIQWQQSTVSSIGILLSGSALAYRLTDSGHQIIMNHLTKASVFGDLLAADAQRTSPVSIRATEFCKVLYIDYMAFSSGAAAANPGYARLMHNYIRTISKRYFALQDRVACLVLPTLREKVLYYLQEQAAGRKGEAFSIPFDRTEMAAYLNADRSALSRTLSELKKEGLLDYYKNTFKLL